MKVKVCVFFQGDRLLRLKSEVIKRDVINLIKCAREPVSITDPHRQALGAALPAGLGKVLRPGRGAPFAAELQSRRVRGAWGAAARDCAAGSLAGSGASPAAPVASLLRSLLGSLLDSLRPQSHSLQLCQVAPASFLSPPPHPAVLRVPFAISVVFFLSPLFLLHSSLPLLLYPLLYLLSSFKTPLLFQATIIFVTKIHLLRPSSVLPPRLSGLSHWSSESRSGLLLAPHVPTLSYPSSHPLLVPTSRDPVLCTAACHGARTSERRSPRAWRALPRHLRLADLHVPRAFAVTLASFTGISEILVFVWHLHFGEEIVRACKRKTTRVI